MLAKLKRLFKSESATVAELQARLEASELTNELLEHAVRGCQASIAFLEKRNEDNYRNGAVTIACLLSAAGGQVTLSNDLMTVMKDSDINIKMDPVEDGLLLTLVPGEAEFEDDCDCDCEQEEAHS